jgi:hypothetical protein
MYFVTEEFLASLLPDVGSSAADGSVGSSVTDIWVDEEAPRFEIDLISDLRIDNPAPTAWDTGCSVPEAERLRAAITDRLKQLRTAFKVSRPADLLVNCGDLIAGRRDTTEAELRRVQTMYEDICLPAFRQLQEPDRTRSRMRDVDQVFPKLLSLPGDGDANGGGGLPHEAWAPVSAMVTRSDVHPYYSHFAKNLAGNPLPKKPESHPVATVFRISARGVGGTASGLECAPLAFIAVVGFDSNDVQYKHDQASNFGQIGEEQLQWSQRLIDALRQGMARSTPLYVVALTHHNLLPVEDRVVYPPRGADDERLMKFQKLMSGGHAGICNPLPRLCVTNHFLAENAVGSTSNASGFLNHLQQLRASLAVHTNMHQRAVTTVVSTPLVAGQSASELTILAAPAFSPGHPTSGMARISLDLWKGQAEIAVYYETAPDGGPAANPTQIICPLISASRVASSERRLYAKVSALIANALANGSPGDRRGVQDFADYVAAVWDSDGYAPVSFPDGTLPHLGEPTRMNRYYLLLLLRQGEGGNYEMLLSRHNANRPSEVAEWDTLLMPAFSSVRDLMERLHLDVVRQVVDQAEDIERASGARTFDAAVELIRAGGGNVQDDIWLEKIRELDTVRKAKISPTTGEITEYEYRLVVLSPFVRDPRSVNSSQVADKAQQRQLNAELAVVEWLSELPSVRLPGAPLSGRQTIPMEAIMSGGAGLRWEPSTDLDDPDEIGEDGSRRRVALPPGAVWFPLADTDEPEGPWTMAPSIVARNADVMRWVDRQLASRRSTEGFFPPHIVLGQMKETTGYSLSEGPFPFAQPDDYDRSETNLSTSTMEAMSRVEYIDEYDLRGQRPYRGLDIRRIALVRRAVRVPSGRERDAVLVFDATPRREYRDMSYFKKCPIDTDSGLLGILRPAQRYVLQAGVERARWVTDFMEENCSDDPWGFLRAKFGGAGEPLALTPPIIEQVDLDDWDSGDDRMLEFVVCDGNHRVVHKVWNSREVAAAIGVVSPPRQPYYARPFSPYEWDITAENVLTVTPDPRFRYAPRRVDLEQLDLSEEARQELTLKPRERLYRRYYRDLSHGFGPIGGQGGRYV